MIHVEQSSYRPPQRSYSELDRDEIVRQTLKEVERRINEQRGNALYRQAWKVVIKILHAMNP
jgi:hypothetical protein